MGSGDLTAKLHEGFDRLLATDVDSLGHDELLAITLSFEKLRSKLEAAEMVQLEAIERRGVFKDRPLRSGKQWLINETNQPQKLIGRRFNLASLVVEKLGLVWQALADARITPSHAETIARLAEKPGLLDALVRDLEIVLDWAQNKPWVVFKANLDVWAEFNDPTDPQDLDDRIHNKRGVVFAQGLEGEVLVELVTNAFTWEQIISGAQQVVDRMFAADWAAARGEHGEAARPHHLTRNDRQRLHDAIVEVYRAGIGGTDPGCSTEVCVVVDLRTIEDETDRQAGNAPDYRPTEHVDSYRCETLSGLRLTPSMAMLAALSGTVRRVVINTPSLDIDVARSARLFKGPLRTAMIIRDRFCTEPGCETRANRCEADHIIPHSRGGPTVAANGKMRCRPSHRHKTRLESLGLWPGGLDDR